MLLDVATFTATGNVSDRAILFVHGVSIRR